ncbi:transcription termination factor NusA [Stratiformator vulcanicus]|uniref:Transcription termination/antitermination protein NusA n=1 Tax=Stratiformator vulcanicus TaxID=2527980 RepID=A0A517R4R8_9PLAN|nr:transcription termination factor NusA [Stratiformator vulcanicus]QDT38878.1 hypothetical protein Pan189_32770 [Stratiformator vulcanicus]
MKGTEILRIVDAIHRDKSIDQNIVFEGIEQAIASAARKHFGEEEEVEVAIDRVSGDAAVSVAGKALDADEIGDLLGRIAAQTAKQVMIQKIREAERDSLHDEYTQLRGQIVNGQIARIEGGGTAAVNLGKVEAILPRGEQIPGEQHHVGERVRSVVMEVRKAGSRVKIILSRNHPELVRRLFEIEIPEVAEHVIEVRSLSREAGYRSKVAVSCYDPKIDCVGACVGVRGARIRNIVEELAGERIDIVRWNDSLQVLVPNALQPAEVEDVILCPQLGKVIVLVQDDQLSLAIGKKGQNVRLASKLVGWDIQVLTQERLDVQIDKSLAGFTQVPHITDELAENLVAQGFFTFDELSIIEPDQLAEMGGLTEEQVDVIVAYADVESLKAEKQEKEDRDRRRKAAALGEVAESNKASAPPETTEAAKPEGDDSESDKTSSPEGESAAESTPESESEAATTDDAPAAEEVAETPVADAKTDSEMEVKIEETESAASAVEVEVAEETKPVEAAAEATETETSEESSESDATSEADSAEPEIVEETPAGSSEGRS